MDWYVDLSAASNGDGTDGNQAAGAGMTGAWNQLTGTELASVNPGDTVWIRRTGTADKKSLTFKDGTEIGGRIEFNGWPLSTDENFAGRPSHSAAGTWDSDGDSWAVLNPITSTPTYQYNTFRRLHWEEGGAGTNDAFYLDSGSPGEFRFYECRANRTGGDLPRIATSGSCFGACEFDRIDVLGVNPDSFNATRLFGPDTASLYVAVRVTMTGGATSAFKIFEDSMAFRSYHFNILEWNDSGNHYLEMENSFNPGNIGDVVITTDDDAVGVLPMNLSHGNIFVAGDTRFTLRNITFNHSLTTPPTSVFSCDGGGRIFLENIEFHPTDHTWQFTVSPNDGHIIGRNITNFDHTKVDDTYITTNEQAPNSHRIHLSQINNTEGWYRNEAGYRAQLTNVFRTGGASNGILVEMLPRDPTMLKNYRMSRGIFRSEFKGLEAFAFVRTGLSYPAAQTLTAYFAVANWDGTESPQDIWFEIEQYKNAAAADFTRKVIDSRILVPSENFIADGSTWNNITGYTAYRVEIPVTIEKDDIIKVRFFVGRWYQTPGGQDNLVVFDPAMTLA